MKNNIIRLKKGLFFAALLGAGALTGCKDIHDYSDITAVAEGANEIYLPYHEYNYFVLQAPTGAEVSSSITISFPVYCSQPAASDIRVMASFDNSLLNVYNLKHGTEYLPFDKLGDSIKFDRYEVIIPQGTTTSSQNIVVRNVGKASRLFDVKGYLLPIRISAIRGYDASVRYGERVNYLSVDVDDYMAGLIKVINNPSLNLYSTLDGKRTPFLRTLTSVDATTTVTLTVNNELIAAYNEKYGTDYQEIPATDFDPVTVVFPPGATLAAGTITYTGDPTALTNPKSYLVPFEVTSVEGSDLKIMDSRKVVYAIVEIPGRTLSVTTDVATMGTPLTSRAGYNVLSFINNLTNAAAAYQTGSANDMFNDNNNAFWMVSGSGGVTYDMIIDLGADIHNMSGLLLQSYNASATYNTKELDLYFASAREYSNGLLTMAGNIKLGTTDGFTASQGSLYIKFDEPLTARYLVLRRMTPNSTSGMGIRTFMVYTK